MAAAWISSLMLFAIMIRRGSGGGADDAISYPSLFRSWQSSYKAGDLSCHISSFFRPLSYGHAKKLAHA